MNLSKTKYVAGQQCPKILWMDNNKSEEKAEQDRTRMEIGLEVGKLACGYFGEYKEILFDKNFDEMISETKRLIEAGTEVITEATFSMDGNFCRVDVLRKSDDGYEIIEVKSSTGNKDDNPNRIRRSFIDDMAYQYYVLTNCGIQVSKVSLMQLNNRYIHQGELDIQELFVILDCTAVVQNEQESISDNIAGIKAIAVQKDEPEMVGSRCKGCAYSAYCFRDMPENNVFDIGWGMRGAKKDELFEKGLKTFEDVYNSSHELRPKPALQVRTVVENLPPHIDLNGIKKFLNVLKYPLYHLDFETYQDAIPKWDGTKPYQQIPFQYSLHIQDAPFARPTHKEFLGKEGTDPRRQLAESLCDSMPRNVCVLTYNSGFEKMCIRGLANAFSDLSEHLMNIHDNILDLMPPFSEGYYYCRDMGGSASIKEVLPALLGRDPYDDLEVVKSGGDAMTLFPILHTKKPEEIEEIRKALLAYCKLDTQAMVWILDMLYEMVGSS